MKINKIQIDHFGSWQNQTFEFVDGIQVISGLNGTGKTTLRAFIQGMLFGFPSAKSHENTFENAYATAVYGGRMWFEHDNQVYELSRHHRTNTVVELKLANTDQELAQPEELLAEMMMPLTAELYDVIYAFNQDGLLEIMTLKPTELLERLRVIGIPNAQGWLRQSDAWVKEAESSMGKTTTAKRPINQKIAQLAEAKATLQRMSQGLPEVTALENRVITLQNEVHELQEAQTQQIVASQYSHLYTQLEEVENWLANQPDKLREIDVNEIMMLQSSIANQRMPDDVSRWYDIERLLAQLSTQPIDTRETQKTTNFEPWLYMLGAVFGGFILGSLIGERLIGTILGLLFAGVIYWQQTQQEKNTVATINPRDARLIEQLAQLGFMVNENTNIAVSRQQVAQEIGKLNQQTEAQHQMQNRLDDLYQQIGVNSVAEFDTRRAQTIEIGHQEQRRDVLKAQLDEVTDSRQSTQDMDTLSNELHQKHTEIAQIEMQLDRLASDQSLKQQRQLVANWESELLADLQDYFALHMAAQWTQQSFDAANNDRWPRLEQQADVYLQTLTKGQYQHVHWSGRTFEVTDYQEHNWDVSLLSRGTAQQLYVALRLAMIAELQAQVDMPLLIDDAFVDFDMERQQALLSLLRNQSESQQIFYFTKDDIHEADEIVL